MSAISSRNLPKVRVKAAEGWNGTSIRDGRVYKNHTDKSVTKSDVLNLVWKWVDLSLAAGTLKIGSSVIIKKGIHQKGHITAMVSGRDEFVHIPVEKIPAEEGKESKANEKGKACAWRLVEKSAPGSKVPKTV